MAPITQTEIDRISVGILQNLSHTPYASVALTPMSGGSCNFIFRGILTQPPSSQKNESTNGKSIIVKRSTNFVAANRDFPLSVSRCIFENCMLNALDTFAPTNLPNRFSVKTPHVYLFDRETNTQLHEDFPNTMDLKSLLISSATNGTLTRPIATSLGQALGAWTHSFHAWASVPDQFGLHAEIGKNEPMQKLKRLITYDSFISILEKQFPDVLEGHQKTLQDVQDWAIQTFEKLPGVDEAEDWGIIHGDFWLGNILVPNALSGPTPPAETQLAIIDWELVQLGYRAIDLGQLIGDLLERKYLNDVAAASWIIKGFLDGYGPLGDDMAFRTAIHTGVHLICWSSRGGKIGPFSDQVKNAIRIGRDLVLRGWEKDRGWFEGTPLASLFERH